MSSPYAAVLRIRRREVDDYGVAISGARELLARLETAMTEHAETARTESRIGTADPLISNHAYMARLRRQRAELAAAGKEADAMLDALRTEAGEAVAALRATEESADQHALEESLTAGRKEQAEFDDMSAARLMRRRA